MKRKFNRISTILVIVGFCVIICAAGKCDYYSEIGEYYPFTKTLHECLFGFLCFVPKAIETYVNYFLED